MLFRSIQTDAGQKYFVGALESITLNESNTATDFEFESGKQYNILLTVTEDSKSSGNTSIFNGKISFTSDVSSWDNTNAIDIEQP